jgi:hypothetical protein
MKQIFLLILIFFTIQIGKTQNHSIELVEKKPKYESIVDICMGTQQWYKNSESDYEAGFQYRIVVTRMEIYETLFIEKLIIDIEGGVSKIEWAKVVDMSALLNLFDIPSEQQNIDKMEWLGKQGLRARLHNTYFKARISDDEKYLIVNKDSNR